MTLPWARQFGNQLLSIYRAEDIEASPLLDLEVIKIVSDCNEEYVSFILGAVMSSHFKEDTSIDGICPVVELCLNVKEINIGMSTGITDETISSLLRGKNTMQHLETFQIQATDKVTMAAVKVSYL